MSRDQQTEEGFLKDVEKHEMKVLLDNGIYRHLRFSSTGQHSWKQWFEIITWPGNLAYSGDMGTYVFERLEDMFEFFRQKRSDAHGLQINLRYWGEKLQAVSRHDGWMEYSPELIRSKVKEEVDEWIEAREVKKEDAKALRQAIEDEITYDDGKDYAYRTISEFSHRIGEEEYWGQSTRDLVKSACPDFDVFQFQDIFEWNWEDYTLRYVWCCYAVAWGIQQYDRFKATSLEAA